MIRHSIVLSLPQSTRSRCSRATAQPVLTRVQSTPVVCYVAKIVCRPQHIKLVGQYDPQCHTARHLRARVRQTTGVPQSVQLGS